MRLLRLVSFMGIVLSLFAHLISWATPDLLHFSLLGVPLHIIGMILVPKLYSNHALPLQNKSDLRWLHHASSGIHALIFLSVLSFMFHSVVVVIGISAFELFLIRMLSSTWLLVYTIGYGYASWASRNQFHLNKIRGQGLHRTRIRSRGDDAKVRLTFDSLPSAFKRRN